MAGAEAKAPGLVVPGPPPRPVLSASLTASKPPARPAPRIDGNPDSSALAGAFQKTVKDEDPALETLGLSVSDEWYVAINGVPVGPIRISELRRKAAAGAVTEESLVWQEGLEEWRPVRTIPDLASIVREAAAGGRVSLVTPPPPEARPGHHPSVPPRPPARAPNAPRPAAPLMSPSPSLGAAGFAQQQQAAARSNVVPINSRLATAERLDDAPPMVAPLAPPSAFTSTATMATDPFAVTEIAAMPSPGAVPFPVTAPMAMPARASIASIPPPAPKQVPWIPIAMVAFAVAFGVVAAIAIFFKPAAQTVQVVAPPTSSAIGAPSSTPSSAAAQQAMDELPATPDPNAPKGTTGSMASRGTSAPKTSAAPIAPAGAKPLDPSIAALISGAGDGPKLGGPSGGPTGGGSSLTEEQLRTVVSMRSAGVKRSCWERGGSQASSANVTVSVVIAASGSVQSADGKGDDPVMNTCIEKAIRGWQFPPAGGTTKVDVPFHFVRQ
jgi:hypothetical protein